MRETVSGLHVKGQQDFGALNEVVEIPKLSAGLSG
jgi:hypothetical protein